jgi:hypothetical protein
MEAAAAINEKPLKTRDFRAVSPNIRQTDQHPE